MSGILLLIPLSVALGASFAYLFLRAAQDGQFDNVEEEEWRALDDDGSP